MRNYNMYQGGGVVLVILNLKGELRVGLQLWPAVEHRPSASLPQLPSKRHPFSLAANQSSSLTTTISTPYLPNHHS